MHTKGKVIYIASVFWHFSSFHIPFMRMLQAEGFEVFAMARTDRPGTRELLEAEGIHCIEAPFSRNPFSLSNVKACRALRKILQETRFEIIHLHTPAVAFIARMAARNTQKGPVVYTVHGFHFYRGAPWANWLLFYSAEKLSRRWTDAVITMNSEDFGTAKRLGYEPERSLFFTHGVGVNTEVYSPSESKRSVIRKELMINDEEIVFVSIGEINKNKNHKWLLRVWSSLNEKGIRLLIAGNGPGEKALENNIRASRLKNVHFLGYRSDVQDLLAASDALVSVSRREGLPRNVMEAMATGLPVIGTNVRGTRDLIEHKDTGLLISLGDDNALRDALKLMIENSDLRNDMGKNAREAVIRYSEQNVVEEIRNIYSVLGVLKDSRRGRRHGH